MPLIIAQAKKSITPSTSAVTAGYPSFSDSNPVQSSSDSSNVIYPPRKKILKSKRIEKLVLNSASEDKHRSTGKETELLPSSSHLDKLHQIECLEKVHYNGIDIEKASSTDSDQTALKRNLDTFLISNTGEANDKDHGLPSSKRLNVQLSELEEGEEDEC